MITVGYSITSCARSVNAQYVSVWQTCELLYTCYLLTYSHSLTQPRSLHSYCQTLCQHGYSYGLVSVSVCLTVTSRCSIETDGRIELAFGMEASFDLSYTVL